MIYKFRAKHHPLADGRWPDADEVQWRVALDLADHGKLIVEMGREDYVHLAAFFLKDLAEDAQLAADVGKLARDMVKT